MADKGFLVQFNRVGASGLDWEERIERPVTNDKIVAAVRRRKAIESRFLHARSTSDYGGEICVIDQTCGNYLIVPGSEVK